MRSLRNQLQDVWICNFEEINIGINRVKIYDKPVKYRLTVSATSGLILGFGAGLSLRYDRFITCFDRKLRGVIKEGQMAFIDLKPEIDDETGELIVEYTYEMDSDGNPIIDEDGDKIIKSITYKTEPDYMIERILDTEKGKVARYGIKKV